MTSTAFLRSDLSGWPLRRGKVRDVYDLGEQLLIVATDRISAFDWVLPTGIPDKGRILTQMSTFWFGHLDMRHHLLCTDVRAMPFPEGIDLDLYAGRTMLCRKTTVFPVECVVRGYLSGSGWKEYRERGTVCDIPLPAGLKESDRLPEPIFTPATKEESGHDQNISFARMCEIVGDDVADELRRRSLDIYHQAAEYALGQGIILADTKFEFGHTEAGILVIDEVLTPDSSRFWPLDQYRPGGPQPSFDKQFVRDWLESTGWDKNSPPPSLPDDVVEKTRAKYIEAYELLSEHPLMW